MREIGGRPERRDLRILRSRFRGEALATLSGVLLALSFPKFGHGALAWVALAPLLMAFARAPGGWDGLRLGYLSGAVSALGTMYWTSLVVTQYGGLSLPVGIAIMVLLCLALALFPSLFGWMVGRWLRAAGSAALLLSPVAWVATETLRAYTFLRFSWCLLGYSQFDNLPVVQLARYTAVYGVSFLVAAVSGVLAYMAVEARPRARRMAGLAMAGVLALVWAHGAWLLRQPLGEAGRIRVGLVQASVLQDEKWDPEKAWENVGRHVELTREARAQRARLVVWPESAVPFYYDHTPEVAGQLQELARGEQVYLLFGNDDVQESAGQGYRVWVGAKMLDTAGDLRFRYHKIRLVPFGEYVPLQPLLTLGGRYAAKLVDRVGDFTPGAEYSLGVAEGHRFGAFICYEAIFPDLVREFTVRGAELLVSMTNDAWFGRTSAPYQHLAMASFRAVENGRYLVRAANTGISAVVDPRGRVVEKTRLFERAVLVREVPFVRGSTFYSRHGDVFAWACLAAAAALTAATLRRR